jgi:hypothetical protein
LYPQSLVVINDETNDNTIRFFGVAAYFLLFVRKTEFSSMMGSFAWLMSLTSDP